MEFTGAFCVSNIPTKICFMLEFVSNDTEHVGYASLRGRPGGISG